MVGQEYSDDDMSTEPYSLRELINNAEVYREKADLTIQTNWEKYQRELKQLKAENMRLMDENKLLKDKLISPS